MLRCVGYKEPGAVVFETNEDEFGEYEFGGGAALYVCWCSVPFSEPGELVIVESCACPVGLCHCPVCRALRRNQGSSLLAVVGDLDVL